MIVYLYETLSEGLHPLSIPRPGHSINASYYASNVILFLCPTLFTRLAIPPSAIKCVLPAVQAVVDKGFVNGRLSAYRAIAGAGIKSLTWSRKRIASRPPLPARLWQT